MKSALQKFAALTAACISFATHAATFVVSFDAREFVEIGGGAPAPTDPVVGWITFSAIDANSPIQSIDGVSLTIDGYSFSASDVLGEYVGNSPFFGAQYAFGGARDGLNQMGSDNFDFFFLTYANQFSYSTTAHGAIWDAGSLQTSISAVPEVGSVGLMVAGLLTVGFYARRRHIGLDASLLVAPKA